MNNNEKITENAAVTAALEQAAAAATELDGEATPTITQAAVSTLTLRTPNFARAGEYLVNVGKGTLSSLTKAFTPPQSEKKLAGWSAPPMPNGLARVKIVAYQYGVRAVEGTDTVDAATGKTSVVQGVHSTRYTLRFTFAGGDKYLPQFAASTGFGGVFYAVGPARLDKMVTLWQLMRDAWGLNAKGEPKR